MRVQEALIATGWPAPAHEAIVNHMELDTEDWRAARAWRYQPKPGAHVLIDADSGALLYLEAFHLNDDSEWKMLPRTSGEYGDYILPALPPVSLGRAATIAEAVLASQYSAYAQRIFAMTAFRPLGKWPVWYLEYEEAVQEQRFPNEFGVMVDWNSGRVVEFCATNLDAPYEIRVDQVAAERLAMKNVERFFAGHECAGPVIGKGTSTYVTLIGGRAQFIWRVGLQCDCSSYEFQIDGLDGDAVGCGTMSPPSRQR